MAWRDTSLDGVHVRIGRVSFSGELAYEVNVMGWYAKGLREKLIAAGEPHGITPYGTETMHVLRAEKGYPIMPWSICGSIRPGPAGPRRPRSWGGCVARESVDRDHRRRHCSDLVRARRVSGHLRWPSGRGAGVAPARRGDRARW
jgi:glycine cleavage system aminomethyltransferase T